jgi:hypothetical protein
MKNWRGYDIGPASKQVGPGWKDIVDPLEELCDRHGVLVMQCKEKFGGLGFYVGGPEEISQEDWDNVTARIENAERVSCHICEECGAPGETRDIGGWLKTVCDQHYEEDKRKISETAKLYRESEPGSVPVPELSGDRLRDNEPEQGLGPRPA